MPASAVVGTVKVVSPTTGKPPQHACAADCDPNWACTTCTGRSENQRVSAHSPAARPVTMMYVQNVLTPSPRHAGGYGGQAGPDQVSPGAVSIRSTFADELTSTDVGGQSLQLPPHPAPDAIRTARTTPISVRATAARGDCMRSRPAANPERRRPVKQRWSRQLTTPPTVA